MKGRAKVNKKLLIAGVFGITLLLTGCGTPTLKNGEEVVASVDGQDFTANDLYEELKNQGGSTVLVNMIDTFIVNKEIETDDDAETYADSQYESYQSSYESNGQNFEDVLTSAGYKDADDFKDALIVEYKKQKITENYVKANLTDAEIQSYYDDNIFGDIEGAHILISPETDDDMTDEEIEEAEEKAKKEAEDIIKKLDDGEDFEDLAKEYSDDEGTASNGGKLTITYGEVVDEFWDAASKLEDGKYTEEPVKSDYGYHIIYRESQKDKPKLNEVEDDVIDKLVDQKLEEDTTLQTEALVDLREKYNFKINDSDINKSYNNSIKEALAETDAE